MAVENIESVKSTAFFRYVYSLGAGGVVALSLIYLMQFLIQSDESGLEDAPLGRLIDFVMLTEDVDVLVKERKPPQPEEEPPEPPPPDLVADVQSIGVDISLDLVADVIIRDGSFANDGEYLPIVKVAPIYPKRAQTRGIEGYVLLEFTVTNTGAVRDPVVIEAQPTGTFDRAAIRAALKFKYKPKVVNGEPVEVAGVRNLITFKLEEG